jgi:hypothetical protein
MVTGRIQAVLWICLLRLRESSMMGRERTTTRPGSTKHSETRSTVGVADPEQLTMMLYTDTVEVVYRQHCSSHPVKETNMTGWFFFDILTDII